MMNNLMQGKKGVWFKLPIEFANLVEAVVKVIFWLDRFDSRL